MSPEECEIQSINPSKILRLLNGSLRIQHYKVHISEYIMHYCNNGIPNGSTEFKPNGLRVRNFWIQICSLTSRDDGVHFSKSVVHRNCSSPQGFSIHVRCTNEDQEGTHLCFPLPLNYHFSLTSH